MSFVIEFEPLGIRLICESALTLLEATRQAGIALRSECGGKGTCGKCQVQIIKGDFDEPAPRERQLLSKGQLEEGYRLACRTVTKKDARIFIPANSRLENQVLQTEGLQARFIPQPAIRVQQIKVTPPSLQDLMADLERVNTVLHERGIEKPHASLPALTAMSTELRRSNWEVNIVHTQNEILHVLPPGKVNPLGLAVDVGTTKLACYLCELESGKTLAARGVINPQIARGEDIMSRLSAVLEHLENANGLQQDVMYAIQQTVEEMCSTLGIATYQIMDACLVGNTAMHHFFLGLPSAPLATSPFIPTLTSDIYPRTEELGLKLMPGARVYAPPPIAGFVGSDHLSFLLASNFGQNNQQTRLGIDIGTNTEIALQKSGRIVSVSTASGPAFEGAHIRFGMRATPGAIEHVTIDEEGKAHCQVIGNLPAAGLCGSGILDAISEFRRTGIINSRGRLEKKVPSVKPDVEGMLNFILMEGSTAQREITISQKDIDQVLLAKGAIRAGIDILMDHLKVQAEEIEEVVIAGAFGSYMNPVHAINIGLLPHLPSQCIHAVGNAAGTGARLMLCSKEMRAKALMLAKQIEYLELTVYPDFAMFFARGIQA